MEPGSDTTNRLVRVNDVAWLTDTEQAAWRAEATLSSRSGTTRAVNRLERAGWVQRVDRDDDRRGTHAELTAAGLAKPAAAAPGHVAAVRAHLVDLLSPRQLAQLHAVGERIRDHAAG